MDSLSQVDSEVGTAVPDHQALALAVLFYDPGTAKENNVEQRFEVEGADARGTVLERWDLPAQRIRWVLRGAVLVDLGRTEQRRPQGARRHSISTVKPRVAYQGQGS